MPKRSNRFQRLVYSLQLALQPLGGKVDESVLLRDRGTGTEREVDILAEISAFGCRLLVAFEVRDRGKRDDVQWIDALVGKYAHLDVNSVAAVSTSGFTPAAHAKPKAPTSAWSQRKT